MLYANNTYKALYITEYVHVQYIEQYLQPVNVINTFKS